MKRNLLVLSVAFLSVGVLFFHTASAFAQTDDSRSFVTRFAQKLGIEDVKVQNAMDEIHRERHNEMQKKLELKLTQAVKDGKITESQKNAIMAKQKEMQERHLKMKKEFKEMTTEERHNAKKKLREEMENWAKEHEINFKELLSIKGRHGMRMKMKFMR